MSDDVAAKVSDIQNKLNNLILLDQDERAALRDEITEIYDAAEAEDPVVDTMISSMTILNNFENLLDQFEIVNDVEDSDDVDDDETSDSAGGEAAVEVEHSDDETSQAESEVAEAETETVQEGESAMAASAAFEAPDDFKPVKHTPVTTRPVVGPHLSGFGLTAGADFRDLDQLNEAFARKIDEVRTGAGGGGEKHSVVTLLASIAEDRQLSMSDSSANQKKIDAVTAQTALVASGGYCAPLPVNYDIFGVGSSARPVRDSLPTFGATRGGIRFIAPPILGAYNDAISLWTAANDANPTNPTVKPSLKVTCASELTATADAVTLSLEFGNLMTRAFPELVQRHNQLSLIQHARFAERTLLNKIAAASTKVTTSHNLGAARDLLLAITNASAAYRNRHRIPRPVRLRAILPEWTRDLIREDIASNLEIENLAVTDSIIDSWFAARGLSMTWHMDDTFSSQSNNAPLNQLPGLIKFWIFAEGTFLFLDGGTLDLGVVRDSDLVGTNDYRTFVETFEGVAKVGIEALEVSATTSIAPAAGS